MTKLDDEYYVLRNNRLFLFIDSGRISSLNLKKIGSGTEADVYEFDENYLIKIYKDGLIDRYKEIYNEERIKEIAEKRDEIEKTNLVYGPVYINQEFRGVLTHNHRYSFNFNIIDFIPSIKFKIQKLLELTENLRELEKNGIYHIDITEDNVLLSPFQIPKIIDTDGKSIRLNNDKNNYYQYRMYGGLFDLFLRKIFSFDIEKYQSDDYLEAAFDGYNIDSSFLSELSKEKYNYELMRDFLNYLKDSKVLSYKRN